MTTPILQLLNVESNYGPVQALRGVSLAVEEGKIVTVLGANGAGKTTTLKTISGIIDPLKGQVKFRGQEIQGSAPDAIVRGGIVHVPEGREVFPLLSVEDNLRMGAYTRSDAGRRRAATSRRCSAISRSCASAEARRPASSPAGSSRCWRSRAPCWRSPRSS